MAEHVAEVFPDLDQSTPALARTCREVTERLADHQVLEATLPFRTFLNADKDRGTLDVGIYEIPEGEALPAHWFPGGRIPTEDSPPVP